MALTKVNTDLLEDGGKLDGIEALADVTDTANVTAAGALMDSELTSEASVKALNQGVATTDSPTFAGLNASGDLTLDVAGDIILDADGADVILKDGGTGFLEIDKDGDNARLKNPIADGDIKIQGIDGASTITALTLDMSAAGAATFNDLINIGGGSLNFTKADGVGINAKESLAITIDSDNNDSSRVFSVLDGSGSTLMQLLDTGAATFSSTVTIGSNLLAEDIKAKGSGGLTLQTDDGVKRIIIEDDGDVVINVTGVDADFRVESDTNTHALFVNAGNSRVGINDDNPVNTLQITEVDDNNSNNSIYNADFSSGPMLKIANPYSGAVPSAQQTKIAGVKMVTVSNGGYGAHSQMHVESKDYAGFDAGDLVFSTGANSSSLLTERLRLNKAEAVFNDVSADVDFRVESNGNTHMLFVDGGNNRIGFGLSNPAQSFAVQFATADRVGTFYDTGTNGNAMHNGAAVLGVSRSSNGSTSLHGPIFEVGRDNGLNATYNVSDRFLTVRSDSTVINEDSQNYDFRVESDAYAEALFLSADVNRFSLGRDNSAPWGQTSGQGSFNYRMVEQSGAFSADSATGYANIYINKFNLPTDDTRAIAFYGNGTQVGTITVSTSATAYNTSSDQRLKENIADADDAGSKIDSIQVRKFDWKADSSHQDYGMVAQELQTVAPEAVSAPENPDEMMGVDYSKLVPMLIKEIQSLRNRVAQLEE